MYCCTTFNVMLTMLVPERISEFLVTKNINVAGRSNTSKHHKFYEVLMRESECNLCHIQDCISISKKD